MDAREKARSWFCVLNNPIDCFVGEVSEIAEMALELWYSGHPTRTGAVAYCISPAGLHHLHMVLEDSNMARFSALKSSYPKAHLEPTKGTKEQAEDYIQKKGKFVQKGEEVLYIARFGEIKGNQGARKDFEVIEELIAQGKAPREIMSMNFGYRRYERMIRQAFYDKRIKETPFKRDVRVIYHVGESGTGKSYESVKLVDIHGEDAVYMWGDYERGGVDNYNGQPILFMDEFRGQLFYATLLKVLDGYKIEMGARYSNVMPLWTEVHITSVFPPEKLYDEMVKKHQSTDTIQQFLRRIDMIVYHWIDEDAKYCHFDMPMNQYVDYEALKYISYDSSGDKCERIELPF